MLRGRSIRHRLPRFRRRATVLPSLYDRHPAAATAQRRPKGLQVVPIERIVGTTRHPSQNTADFLPLPGLRGKNWQGRWLRIRRATRDLAVLPAVELVQVGDEYYVIDGHNRVAAAIEADAVAIDADVTELVIPGVDRAPQASGEHQDAATLLLGADEVRQAAAGHQSRTTEHRTTVDTLRREQLTRPAEREAERDE